MSPSTVIRIRSSLSFSRVPGHFTGVDSAMYAARSSSGTSSMRRGALRCLAVIEPPQDFFRFVDTVAEIDDLVLQVADLLFKISDLVVDSGLHTQRTPATLHSRAGKHRERPDRLTPV